MYSVASWHGKDTKGLGGRYAEWYWHRLKTKSKIQKNFQDFHNRAFGPNVKYSDMANMFKAEFFEPDAWASMFKNAGLPFSYSYNISSNYDYPLTQVLSMWSLPRNITMPMLCGPQNFHRNGIQLKSVPVSIC